MAFLLSGIQAVSGALGIVQGIKSLFGGGKKDTPSAAPEPKPLPKAPTPEDAQAKAKTETARRRRISILSGGQTNVTRGQSLLQAGDVGRQTLGGA